MSVLTAFLLSLPGFGALVDESPRVRRGVPMAFPVKRNTCVVGKAQRGDPSWKLGHQFYLHVIQGVGYYLHREGPNLGKTSCPLPPVTISLRRTVWDPLPEIQRF